LKREPGLQEVFDRYFFNRHGTPDLVLLDLNRKEGELAMWYIVLSRSLPDKEEDKQLNAEEHRKWLEEQHRTGRLLFSGPTADRAYGIYIMLAASLSEAERIASQDPHHLRGIRTMEVLEWRAHRAFRLDGPTIAEVERIATGSG
jgi:uncharacterized protein YciI